jgi:hypothetical protein
MVRDRRSASLAAVARANKASGLATSAQRASASTPRIRPLTGSICGWKRISISSPARAASRRRSRAGATMSCGRSEPR